ncbi:uncharacterized protein LOC122979752 [Scomber scombrus]
MPQNGMTFMGRGRETRRNTCRANGLMNGHVPGTGLVNGAAVHNGFPAAANGSSESMPAGTHTSAKPQCMVNGYINHVDKGKRTKAPSPKTFWKQRSTTAAVAHTSAADRVCSGGTSGGILVNWATSLDTLPSPDQMASEPSLSAAAKNQQKRRKFRHKKRRAPYLTSALSAENAKDTDLAHPENSTPLLMPPHEEEDWEKEIQEITITNWEKMCFGVRPYGPEDLLHFALRDLTLKQRDSVDRPVTANYSPSAHHPPPLKWSCYSIPTEPDQFADADS